MSNLQVIEQKITSIEPQFVQVLSDKSISFQRETGFAMQALSSNDFLATAAIKNQQSLINAITNVAAIGVSLNPAEKQAYLVPRKGAVCLDISYLGLIDLATSSGSIQWAKAELVYSNDTFELVGVDKQPIHTRNPFSSERGSVVGAYCVAKLPNGDYLTEAMSKSELDRIKSMSELGKKGIGPWSEHEGEMQRKTVVKRASKYWPKSERLAKAIHMLDTESGEGIEPIKVKELDQQRLAELKAQASAADDSEALSDIWKKGLAEIRAHGSMIQYEDFKNHVFEVKNELEGGGNA